MARNYVHTLFTDEVRAFQEADGSREAYARMEAGADGAPDPLTEREIDFIGARDSFYMASVTSAGWPYVQHRGGPPGFLKVLPGNRLGFADYRGNRQHVSTANLAAEPRISLFLMDYPNRRRLKILGLATIVSAAEDPALVAALMPDGYKAGLERAYAIEVVGYDWNCPQHITPRFTEAEIRQATAPMIAELETLRAEVARLRAQSSEGNVMITLYDSALSGNCQKVRMALAFLGLEHELIPADAAFRRTPKFLAINPMGQVPVLADGAFTLRDSQAILAYLAARHRPGDWDGRTPEERGEIAVWLAHAANEILNGPGFVRIGKLFGAPVDEAHHRAVADRILPVIEAHLQSREWLACGRLTIADLAAAPYLALMGDGGLALGDWPAISAWADRIACLLNFPGMSGWSKASG